ncbi:secretion protein [Anaeromyxobacter oryzisoli]|uniref:secretion protein n=1 Tax=Anaeromyxobacter oryzisoli TaxID=2925408 RepID=UPI001F5A6B0B|nr:secretion protein [Anaeromyxobacter sp. SG63]
MRSLIWLALPAALAGCGREELFHRLDEPQANEVLVALDEGGIAARKEPEDGTEGGWLVSVASGDAAPAHRLLSARDLPRARPPGFGDVFSKGSLVPTPVEEHALYLHALAGELARSVEAIDGVVGARVHLGLPQPDPLRPGERAAPRAAVLVRCRPAACAAVRSLEPGVRALVAGAADGLRPEAVAVVISEATEASPPRADGRRRSPVLLAIAALAALAAAGIGGAGLFSGLRKGSAS